MRSSEPMQERTMEARKDQIPNQIKEIPPAKMG
jgi:hypothetical protein